MEEQIIDECLFSDERIALYNKIKKFTGKAGLIYELLQQKRYRDARVELREYKKLLRNEGLDKSFIANYVSINHLFIKHYFSFIFKILRFW